METSVQNDDRIDEGSLDQHLREMLKRIRPHANFFDWPVKATKEFRITVTLLDSVGEALAIESVRPGYPDPPDVVGIQGDGSLVAIEVTELVDEEVIAHNVHTMRETEGEDFIERGKRLVYRDWDKPGLIEAVGALLSEKDVKRLNGGPFARYVVALHTDEMALTHADADEWLRDHIFGGMRQVTEAYLLLSPGLESNGCTHIRLNVGP
jgi:hypothetical protein